MISNISVTKDLLCVDVAGIYSKPVGGGCDCLQQIYNISNITGLSVV
jgi:hypothetical protein